MMSFTFRNVNDAFEGLIDHFNIHQHNSGVIRRSPSRNGEVLRAVGPVGITYRRPCERVLFNRARDANPFFHLYESLWMLGGRNDLESLQYYVSTFDQFSDDGVTLNGAYGHRWRNADAGWSLQEYDPDLVDEGENNDYLAQTRKDQLSILIDHLLKNPNSRRAVLQMWNVQDDLMKIDTSKDVCCNLSAVFEVVTDQEQLYAGVNHKTLPPGTPIKGTGPQLNMTVYNRSNDLIWGTLGANAVHFSFLQEYVAAALGVEVGDYNQITTNLHVYTDKFNYHDWSAQRGPSDYDNTYKYFEEQEHYVPLVRDINQFEIELGRFLDNNETVVQEPFLKNVAQPMCLAFRHHKERDYNRAIESVKRVDSLDWAQAGFNWLTKRRDNWRSKNNVRDRQSEQRS